MLNDERRKTDGSNDSELRQIPNGRDGKANAQRMLAPDPVGESHEYGEVSQRERRPTEGLSKPCGTHAHFSDSADRNVNGWVPHRIRHDLDGFEGKKRAISRVIHDMSEA